MDQLFKEIFVEKVLFLFSGSVAASILLRWDSAGEKDDQPYRVVENPLFLDWEFLYLHLEKKQHMSGNYFI